MLKNVAGQIIPVYAWNNATGVPITGDAANITAQISIDGGVSAPTDDVNPAELDAADHPGVYFFNALQAESNGNLVIVTPVSSTPDIVLKPAFIYTQTVMRGTDGANTTVPDAAGVAPTKVEIRQEIDSNSTRLDADITSRAPASEYDTEMARITANVATATALSTHDGKLDALNNISVADIIAGIADGDLDLQEMLRIIVSACAGKSSGGSTTELKFRDSGDGKDRITATVDANGNRTAITLDGS